MGPAAQTGRGVARAALTAALVLAGVACSGGTTPAATPADTGPPSPVETAGDGPSTADRLCAARPVEPVGALAASDLVETSGIAASRVVPGLLWAHNDSGGGADLFALGLDGSDRGRVELAGVEAVDWEDIALVHGAEGEPDRLLVADIGDNPGSGSRASRSVRLHRVDEPIVAAGTSALATVAATAVATIDLTYADGPRDAETLLADPLTGDVFVVSKQWDGSGAGVYLVPAAVVSTAVPPAVTMARVATVGGAGTRLVTGGDVSPDGRAVVLRTYTAVTVWARDPAVSVPDTVAGRPTCTVPVIEPQGEAVAVLVEGSGFVTVSEGEGASVLVRREP